MISTILGQYVMILVTLLPHLSSQRPPQASYEVSDNSLTHNSSTVINVEAEEMERSFILIESESLNAFELALPNVQWILQLLQAESYYPNVSMFPSPSFAP